MHTCGGGTGFVVTSEEITLTGQYGTSRVHTMLKHKHMYTPVDELQTLYILW